MKFIKLATPLGIKLVNAANIYSIEHDPEGADSIITFTIGSLLRVNETPEQILARIENTDRMLLEETKAIRALLEARLPGGGK